ncbi:CU044_5270 family protein [Amycolatopsis sp. NBC_01488]|uniref:CU044_5270 family protein n=1 Tax=Amycolatopsis sp. NBC_01488 TaxID=2903563 RepID=UPI002E2BDE04|nr:CU044_5270 family protein [Amycolatopsis sp. NBC_01488]
MADDNVRPIWSDAELDTALADLHADPGSDDDLAFVRTSLLAAAGAPPEKEPAARPKSRGSWRWIAVAAAVAALTGGLVVATQVTDREPAVVTPAVPGLDQLRGTDLPVSPGEFRHTTSSMWFRTKGPGGEPAGYLGTLTELWIPADPATPWHLRSKASNDLPGLAVPAPHLNPVPLHSEDQLSGPGGLFPTAGYNLPAGFAGSWNIPTAKFIATLPADADRLRTRLLADRSTTSHSPSPETPNSPALVIRMAYQVLETGLPRGDVRVALWRALSRIDGIVTAPGTRAPDGRTGIGFTARATGETLIADPATAQLIGRTEPPDPTPGTSRPKSGLPASPQQVWLAVSYWYTVTETDH